MSGRAKRREEIVEEREPRRPTRAPEPGYAPVPALWSANPFVIQRRLKELEERHAESARLLANVFLIVQELRDGLEERQGAGRGLRLPAATVPPPDHRFAWWERMICAFFFPWVLRRPATGNLDALPA